MRTNGALTQKNCYNLKVMMNGIETLNKDFKTLRDISNELGFSYNKVVELKRKKNKIIKGTYEPHYIIDKISEYKIVDDIDVSLSVC